MSALWNPFVHEKKHEMSNSYLSMLIVAAKWTCEIYWTPSHFCDADYRSVIFCTGYKTVVQGLGCSCLGPVHTLNSYALSSITSFFCQYLLLCHRVSILYLCFPVTTLISETRMAKIKWLPMSFMIKISQNALNVVTVPSTCSYSTSCSSLYASVNV